MIQIKKKQLAAAMTLDHGLVSKDVTCNFAKSNVKNKR